MRSSLVIMAAAATAGLAAGGFAYAARFPTSQIFGRVLLAGDDPRQLALTYDDGPNPSLTPRLLDLLEEAGVHATFFLIGSFARQYPDLARRISRAGHLIGNHTMSHPKLALQAGRRIQNELQGTNQLLEDLLGTRVGYFRPPHGSRRPLVLRVARDLGLKTVMWNVTASDWNPIGARAIAENVEGGIARNRAHGRGSNILLHDGGHAGPGADREATLLATSEILRRYSREDFVTVDAWF